MGGNFRNRIQEGNIHNYFRGNNRKIVFYNDNDKIEFLKRCNRFSKQYETTILEFVLMDNHVHLQVDTKNDSGFMKSLQMSYVQWYNHHHNLSDKLFKTPFNSACKFTEDWIIDSMLYILKNPVKANICQKPSDFKWSSIGFHFNGDSPLREFIDVDTSIMDKHFKTKANLEKAIMEYSRGNPAITVLDYDTDELSTDSCDTGESDPADSAERKTSSDPADPTEEKEKPKRKSKRPTANMRNQGGSFFEAMSTSILCEYINEVLKGKSLFLLNRSELEQLVIRLYKETNASFRQLSALTNLNYDYVRKICGCGKGSMER